MSKNIDTYIPITAETGNISQAAQRLGISQPALSAHIKKVEEDLGITIFDRTKKPFKLTEEGRAYLDYAARRENLYKDFRAHLSDLSNLQTGCLVVGGATTFNMTYLPKAVKIFTEKYPGIELRILDDKVPNIIARTLSGEIDLFLSPTKDDAKELVYQKLFENRVVLCVPAHYSENRKLKKYCLSKAQLIKGDYSDVPPVNLREFEECTFLTLAKTQNLGRIMSELFEKYDFEAKREIMIEQAMTSYAMSGAGAGISLFNDTAVRYGTYDENICYYLLDESVTSKPLYICHSESATLSKASRAFIDILQNLTVE